MVGLGGRRGMSTVLAAKAVRFYDSTIGKKAVMAVTGLILFGFLVAHMLGNLQVFIGPEQMDRYSAMLHAIPELLWTARIILLISVLAHIWSWLALASNNKAARPVGYQKPANVQASLGSRTMSLSGPVIAAFVIIHLLHLTTGTIHPGVFVELHAYENVISGFTPPFALLYIVVMLLVGTHLSHGIWSMFQSVGFSHPRYTPMIKKFAAVFSWILIGGFIAVPISVLLGLVK
jgi:succinate dehydrogenase / fumarate reductase cytochrome b subunit